MVEITYRKGVSYEKYKVQSIGQFVNDTIEIMDSVDKVTANVF